MNKIKKKIGILPNSVDFSHPQDRRRYVPFLTRLGSDYEIAEYDKSYDILYLSLSCDLNMWAHYRRMNEETRIIFDLSDNYLKGGPVQSLIRSVGHYVTGRTDSFKLDYRVTIKNILNVADVICVGSVEQKTFIENYTNGEVLVVRDSFEEFGNPSMIHSNYHASSNEINICWEGFSHSITPTIKFIKDFVSQLERSFGKVINIYFITDRKSCKYFGRYLCEDLESILEREFRLTSKVNAVFLDWSVKNMIFVANNCHFSIIPICGNEIARSKPENKLLLFWYLGLPVIASNIPSYSRVYKQFGLSKFCCSTMEEWVRAASYIIGDTQEYMKSSEDIYHFINDNLSTAAIDQQMKIVFGL